VKGGQCRPVRLNDLGTHTRRKQRKQSIIYMVITEQSLIQLKSTAQG